VTAVVVTLAVAAVIGLLVGAALLLRRRPSLRRAGPRQPRLLVPFTSGGLDSTVLDAAIRIARAEDAVLVPAYLVVVPFKYAPSAPVKRQVSHAMPLLEAVEHAALRSGIAVDARIERGRTPVHALRRLWEVEHFDRVLAPAPRRHAPGFTTKELMWILEHAPSETLILKPSGNGGLLEHAESAA
jgi:hypothetical protein